MDRTYHGPARIARDCPLCGSALRLRRRRCDSGTFLGCAAYPSCRHAEEYDHHVDELARYAAQLEADLAATRRHRCQPTPPSVDVARELRSLVFRWHPDRHPEPIPPHDVVAELTALRTRITA